MTDILVLNAKNYQ